MICALRTPPLAATLACAVAFVVLSAAGTAVADPAAELAKFKGSYKFAGTRDDAMKVIGKAIDDGLSQVNIVMRTVIKKAIEGRKGTYIETISIDAPGSDIVIKLADYEVKAPNGKAKSVTSPDGRPTTVKHELSGGALKQSFTGEDGSITNTFTLKDGGKTLRRKVTITSKRLSKPVTYQLSYTRR